MFLVLSTLLGMLVNCGLPEHLGVNTCHDSTVGANSGQRQETIERDGRRTIRNKEKDYTCINIPPSRHPQAINAAHLAHLSNADWRAYDLTTLL